MSRTLSLVFCPILFAHFLFQFGAFANDEINYGLARYVKGELYLLAKGEKTRKAMRRMDKFYDGSELSTGPKSFAILKLPDGSTLKLDPDSNLKVEGLIQAKGKTYKGSSYLILTVGGVMIDVIQKFSGPPSLEVETANRVAFGVRGTTFYVFHDQESNDIWSTVHKGRVEAMDYMHDDSEMIEAGMSLALVEGEVITKPHKYKWADQLRWSFAETDLSLETNRVITTEERLKELQSLYQKLRTRSKKTFLKQKKSQEASRGDGYRPSDGEYQLNEAGMYSTNGGSNETALSSGTDQDTANQTPDTAPAPTAIPAGTASVVSATNMAAATFVANPSSQTEQQSDGTLHPVEQNQTAQDQPADGPPPPVPPSTQSQSQTAELECSKITGAESRPNGCINDEISAATVTAGNTTFHCCVDIPTNGNKIEAPPP
ncbi:MAG: FecR domain-containing protein [Bdellovibrio sp.]|nr:FecR domain-containing protein [Bdellovibrio sp.]